MNVLKEEYRHPNQVTLVRLAVYEQPEGFLVTEERIGTATVVGTLGFVDSRERAESLVRDRAGSLRAQRYERVDAPGPEPAPAGPVGPTDATGSAAATGATGGAR
jgi:hypothetical protein